MTPRVSIIVPVYNVEKYVEACLVSVSSQTVVCDIECIVVDDRGNDRSIEVVDLFIDSLTPDKQKIFRLIHRDENGGLSAARNTGIREAIGEYIYFLDSDDYLMPNTMEILLSLADKYGGVDLLPALYKRDDCSMDHFNVASFPEFSDDRRLIKRTLLDYDKMPVTAANRLVRREFLLKHNLFFQEGIIHEDNYWTFFLSKYVKRMAFCPKKLYYYRITEGSITRKVNIQKESLAFKTMITDFSNNIDSFEEGAQKKLIFLNVLTMWNNKYYASIEDAKKLVRLFMNTNKLLERLLIYICFYVGNKGWMYEKIVNLIQKVYMK